MICAYKHVLAICMCNNNNIIMVLQEMYGQDLLTQADMLIALSILRLPFSLNSTDLASTLVYTCRDQAGWYSHRGLFLHNTWRISN